MLFLLVMKIDMQVKDEACNSFAKKNWVEHEGVESYIRMKLTRSALRILCDLNKLRQN